MKSKLIAHRHMITGKAIKLESNQFAKLLQLET